MQEDKEQLEHRADALSKRLAAVMQAKYQMRGTEFDAETPIDKVLNVMHSYIDKVRVWEASSHAVRASWLIVALPS